MGRQLGKKNYSDIKEKNTTKSFAICRALPRCQKSLLVDFSQIPHDKLSYGGSLRERHVWLICVNDAGTWLINILCIIWYRTTVVTRLFYKSFFSGCCL